jgi:outer membrane receptor protein involved in Fe transport
VSGRHLRAALSSAAFGLWALSVTAQSGQPRSEEEITVTATLTETRVNDSPSSVAVVSRADLDRSAAPTLDDALRAVPGFTLFRRSGSRTANPTTQGVSLRGVGASGASRTLVLDDGVPLNDPFGGWIHWGRVPREAIARVELLRGGGSDLYGSSALGGVIQVIRRNQQDSSLAIQTAVGTADTGDLSLHLTHATGDWRISGAAEALRTDGYIPVASDERGSVDVEANSRRRLLEGSASRQFGATIASLRLSNYAERRGNGTPLQFNNTQLQQAVAGVDGAFGDTSFSARLSGTGQDYQQTFTAVLDDRSEERLIRTQKVPSHAWGASGHGSRPITSSIVLVGGGEVRRVRGRSEESIPGSPAQRTEAGGSQEIAGAFAEALVAAGARLSLTVGMRYDRWENERREGAGENEASRSEDSVSPRVAAIWRVRGPVSITGSAYRAFRAPTLNELYRPFRVGSVLTLANDDLQAETLNGIEAGVVVDAAERGGVRATVFRMEVDDPIANVTIAETPSLITRQRRNLGSTRSDGLELDAEARFGRWTLSGGFLLVRARVGPGSDLRGLRLPQVPEHQATIASTWRSGRGLAASAELRWSGSQFDDDRNTLRLDQYAVVNVHGAMPVSANATAFGAVENVLDEEYEVGRTPTLTVGQPRTVRIGLRFRRSF